MTALDLLGLGLLTLVLALGVLALVALLRHAPRSSVTPLLERGDFAGALARLDTVTGEQREDLFAAAQAARHLEDFARAEALVARILDADPDDGEAWLERGLTALYGGDPRTAAVCFDRAESLRSDLREPLDLHRAWLALREGRRDDARRLFEEIEAPLESKLRTDLGPGDPLFAEWFLQAADLWDAAEASERAAWARQQALRSAPHSALLRRLAARS